MCAYAQAPLQVVAEVQLFMRECQPPGGTKCAAPHVVAVPSEGMESMGKHIASQSVVAGTALLGIRCVLKHCGSKFQFRNNGATFSRPNSNLITR